MKLEQNTVASVSINAKNYDINFKEQLEKHNKTIINWTLVCFAIFHMLVEVLVGNTYNAGISVVIQFIISKFIIVHTSDLTKKKGLIGKTILISLLVLFVRFVLGMIITPIFTANGY